MSVTVVVGTQWGDEAKGKVVDYLAQSSDLAIRHSGGANAGHTVCVGDQIFKFHIIPSSILNASVECVLSDGVVFDPERFVEELKNLSAKGVSVAKLRISPRCHLVFPYHKELDRAEEEFRTSKIGTTGQGIGPASADRARRIGIQVGDLFDPKGLRYRLEQSLTFNNALLERFGRPPVNLEALTRQCLFWSEALRPFVRDPFWAIREAVHEKTILVEGAQGTMLDIQYGPYPYVTSSHPTAGGACLGTGLSPSEISCVIGVAKCYTSRVGEGSLPTELHDEIATHLRTMGREYGTTTGRPRRIGWLDVVMLRFSKEVNGLTSLAITMLDVLSGLEEIKICVAYSIEGKIIDRYPMDQGVLAQCRPIYKTMKGWSQDISKAKGLSELPLEAREYLQFISDALDVRISIVSVGARRDQTIFVHSLGI